jgi:hypothetical protein
MKEEKESGKREFTREYVGSPIAREDQRVRL